MEIVSDIVQADPKNPIIDAAWLNKELKELPETRELAEVNSVFNPGGIQKKDGTIVLMARFETRSGSSGLITLESQDGDFWQVVPKSIILSPTHYGGFEDPRIVWMKELDKYVISYVSAEHRGSFVALMSTEDFRKFDQIGQVSFANEDNAFLEGMSNKDACLLPRMLFVNNKMRFGLIHRPEYESQKAMWFSLSEERNLIKWRGHKCIAQKRPGTFWDNSHIGLATQPIEVPGELSKGFPDGLLVFYHGVQRKASNMLYRVAAMWFAWEGLQITHRNEQWIFGPKESFHSEGDVLGAIFPCAAWFDEKINKIVMYYGIADLTIGRAFWDVERLMNNLKKHPV